mmetsp:Transcript_39247/g.92556  ORF Transcript_39247/g.92556 Transcript_39247/m.92556 type:complete len:502 (+) Transcript_39247:135-1640(+)|eukprot:CAMPEP_0177713042 /NCGR_PEP_ID=MMETSP0484_2-20121128/12722_1 /TAXON_ID=354590 /ORGANISM="Rhodomonas lens, Strain RHODO" /LENGTH=501 /DNA_ID=CAMNT_0019224893 /DNA_START=125 /DNA_END=1630 /DNA_ORIENTATION=-
MTAKKRITQDTFDEAVRENMDDFDMPREEAIKDAMEQFEMQGIDLTNIVTSTSCSDEPEHPVLSSTKKIKELVATTDCDEDSVLGALTALADALREATDAEAKTMAGNAGAVEAIVSALKAYPKSVDLVLCAFKLLNNLITKADLNRDKLKDPAQDNPSMKTIVEVLECHLDRADVQEAGYSLVKTASTKCEALKAAFIQHGGINSVKSAFELHLDNPSLLKEVGGALHVLTNADDYSTMLSKVFDTAKDLAGAGLLPLIYAALRKHMADPLVLKELFAAMKGCSVQDDIVKSVVADGGLELVLQGFKQHMEHPACVARAMLLLSNMAENDDVKKELGQGDALNLIMGAMQMHSDQVIVVRCGLTAMASLALRMPDNCDRMVELGAAPLIVESVRRHPGAAELNRQAMMAVRNMVVRKTEFRAVFLDEGLEDLIKAARDTHIKCADAAFDCLRDLGCEYGGLGDQAGKGKHSAYTCDDSLVKSSQVRQGSAMVTWEEDEAM